MAIKKKARRKTRIQDASPEEMARFALSEVKRKLGTLLPPPPAALRWNETRVPSQMFSIVARMVETPKFGHISQTFLARVKVVMTSVPEIPEVVTLESKVFVLVNTAPLTYTQGTSSEATRVK
jgi:hypothetical protein